MSKLDEIKKLNFKITWKLIRIGYLGYENIQPQIDKQDVCNYAYYLLENMESNYNKVVQLITQKENDYEFNQILNHLAKLDNSNIELQVEKWIIFLTKKMIENLGDNYLENLLNITEFWVSLGQPNDSPHIFQSVGNKITPETYYTEEMYNVILQKHIEWISKQIQRVIQVEDK